MTPVVQPINNINPYRYIRFVRILSNKNSDLIYVYFDAEDQPQLYFQTTDSFINHLDNKHNLTLENHPLLCKLKSAIENYNIHYVIDTKKWTLVLFEEPGEKRKTMKEEIKEEFNSILSRQQKQRSRPQAYFKINTNKSKSPWLPF